MLLIANHKMFRTHKQVNTWLSEVNRGLTAKQVKGKELVACVTYTALPLKGFKKLKKGAQNCHEDQLGRFTGEVSPKDLAELKTKYVIVGHSERRMVVGETDELVNKKIKAVLRNGMTAVMCIGEPLEIRKNGNTKSYIINQLDVGLRGVSSSKLGRLVVAYEPVWAISPGGPAEPEDAFVMSNLIRDYFENKYNKKAARALKVLYGGSVNRSNASSYVANGDVDGLLIGKASIDSGDFMAIVKNIK